MLNNIQPTCGQLCGIEIDSQHDMIWPLCGVHGRDGHGAKGADGGTDGRVGSRGEGTWRGSHANGLPNKMSQETCNNMFIVFIKYVVPDFVDNSDIDTIDTFEFCCLFDILLILSNIALILSNADHFSFDI